MEDEVITKMARAATDLLSGVLGPPASVDNLVPSYNSLLRFARENHPEDKFLSSIAPIESGSSTTELAVLFAQLHLAVEATSASASS